MASPPPVSVFILSRNEEAKIGPALESVAWAREIVVIDSFSTDRTVEIAASRGARVVQVKFEGFGALRRAGIEHTREPWFRFPRVGDRSDRITHQPRESSYESEKSEGSKKAGFSATD
jgi:glycosyltransferase involved in cell wall biosynthesis